MLQRCASHSLPAREATHRPAVHAEFVLAIASEANEICEKDLKKTMLPEHILAALKVRPLCFAASQS